LIVGSRIQSVSKIYLKEGDGKVGPPLEATDLRNGVSLLSPACGKSANGVVQVCI
jgi:hypothetical protein